MVGWATYLPFRTSLSSTLSIKLLHKMSPVRVKVNVLMSVLERQVAMQCSGGEIIAGYYIKCSLEKRKKQ